MHKRWISAVRKRQTSNFKPLLIYFGFALILSAGCVTKNAYSSSDQAIQQTADNQIDDLVANDNFDVIFKDPSDFANRKLDSGYDLTDAVTKYVRACCNDKERALSLLRNHGFTISKNIVDVFTGENAKYDYRKQGYDEVYGAEKQTDFHPMYPVYTNNQVTIFIRHGIIVKVAAFSFQDGL
jgi:hypothetical protein